MLSLLIALEEGKNRVIKKSVVIAGRHDTSISLEDEFYEELMKIAKAKNMSINQLVTQIDMERNIENLSSAVRVYVLQYLKKQVSEGS